MAELIVDIKNLKKSYPIAQTLCQILRKPFSSRGKISVLNGVSFSISPNEIVGLTGENGAGKTTLLRILAGLGLADDGLVGFWPCCGISQVRQIADLRNHIGYVSSDERGFFWRLTGWDNLMFFARMYSLSKYLAAERAEKLLSDFELTAKSKQLFRDYSAGTKKKFSIIRGLLHRPALVLMDEATNSLDPSSADTVESIIKQYSKNHRCCVLWSTHRLNELGSICDKAVKLKGGKVEYL